jgi:hypothetical protein
MVDEPGELFEVQAARTVEIREASKFHEPRVPLRALVAPGLLRSDEAEVAARDVFDDEVSAMSGLMAGRNGCHFAP